MYFLLNIIMILNCNFEYDVWNTFWFFDWIVNFNARNASGSWCYSWSWLEYAWISSLHATRNAQLWAAFVSCRYFFIWWAVFKTQVISSLVLNAIQYANQYTILNSRSLGICLYEMLIGKPPNRGNTVRAMLTLAVRGVDLSIMRKRKYNISPRIIHFVG